MATADRLPTAKRRQQIAEATLRILSTGGVKCLTAAALAEEVGIADGTIFRHFRNMQEIVNAAIEHFAILIEETFPPDDGEPLDRLRAFVDRRLALVREHPELVRLVLSDRLSEAAGKEGSGRVDRLVERSWAFIGRCLEEARERGDLAVDAPLTLGTWMVVGVLRGAANERGFRVRDEPPLSDRTPEEVWSALHRALSGISGKGEA